MEEQPYASYFPAGQSPISNPGAYLESAQTQQLIEVLTEHETILDTLKMQLRGEIFYEDPNTHEKYMKQIEKPTFVMLDKLNQPVKFWNDKTRQFEYIPNDEAIAQCLSVLKYLGLNPVAPLTTIDENEIRADLMEMESKIAVMLCVKRKKWGIDKALYPVEVGKLKVLIKDARYRSKDGVVLKALRTITSRIEQTNEQKQKATWKDGMKSLYS